MNNRRERVVVVGAGVGGLVAALELAHQGLDVTVLERSGQPGGKLRQIEVDGTGIDAGPTVFTMREVFEEIFDAAGASLTDHLRLTPARVLARHAWSEHERLDLFADRDAALDAIARFAGPGEARRYQHFCERSHGIYSTLEQTFIRASRPSTLGLARRIGLHRAHALWRISPYTTMWRALGDTFRDPRLQQLFGRYATYCGSCPFLSPATLMLVAHVERRGVWLVEGGMHRLAAALANLLARRGATIRYRSEVVQVLVENGRAVGVQLSDGDRIGADAVVMNADPSAIAGRRFGPAIARAVPKVPEHARSLSALTWTMHAQAEGFALSHHNVFFARDYAAEFDDILWHQRLPRTPSVYVCAQDRDAADGMAPGGMERLLCIVNAPAIGDRHLFGPTEIEQCEQSMTRLMHECGLRLRSIRSTVTTPTDFERLFPGTGGALYGPASHGWTASFRRPGSRTRMRGLYLAGGSTHPGPGVPMAAISGRLAAQCVRSDLVSTRRSHPVAMRGGMSMG